MKILTFDTSLNKTYITYGVDDKIIVKKEICSDSEKYHSAYLIPEIIDILKSENIMLQDIDAIGINEGPGSFTGIRICTVIARTAAQQLGIKVVPVPSLEILSKINSTDKKSLVVLDARKQKAYIAIYNGDEVVISPKSINIDELSDLVAQDEYQIITDFSMHEKLQKMEISSVNYEADDYPLGKFLYEIVYKKLQNPENDYFWAKVKPLYIQPPSITPPKKVGA